MHKLIIMLESSENPDFDEQWPRFLSLAENMPGLQREVTSRVERVIFGVSTTTMIHELYFESLEALQEGMASPQGREAGAVLQSMTQGRMTLLFADHREDNIENIRKYQQVKEDKHAEADAG